MRARVLFTSWPFEGHVFPQLAIALAQRRRGDDVAFYTGRRLQGTIESQGLEVFPFDRLEGAWERVQERERAARGRRQSLRVQREAFRHWLVESIPDQVADLRAVIADWRPDVIATDTFMWGPSLVLWEADRIPVALSAPMIFALVPGPDAPPAGSRLGVPRTARARMVARAVGGVTDLLARGLRRRLGELRAGYGLSPMGCGVNEFYGRLPLYLVGSVPELDLRRRDLPSSVRYVGPLLWHPPDRPGTAAWLEALPTGAPWVHVTEGTSHHQQSFLLEAAATGLAGAPIEAILTTGRDRDPADLGLAATAPNVHVARWLSHGELLPRCAAVVTTGGPATIMSALRAGVPLVVVPTTWDKPDCALRVVEAGVGVRLGARRCTPERLRAAVEHVLREPRYRDAAAAMARRLATAPGPAGAAELLAGLTQRRRPSPPALSLEGGVT
jgi:UDP:flavonoid glycosyltransferase YjiC (YdhE family)